jgi:hypothetical protein
MVVQSLHGRCLVWLACFHTHSPRNLQLLHSFVQFLSRSLHGGAGPLVSLLASRDATARATAHVVIARALAAADAITCSAGRAGRATAAAAVIPAAPAAILATAPAVDGAVCGPACKRRRRGSAYLMHAENGPWPVHYRERLRICMGWP